MTNYSPPTASPHGLTGAGGAPLRGAANFKPFFHTFKQAFPDIEVVVEDTIAEGDKVVARCTVRGQHHGDTLGFAATKRPVLFDGITITRWRDGQIVEAWNNFDFLGMYHQLGVAPPPPDANATGSEQNK